MRDSLVMRFARRLCRDARTARTRLAYLRHPATFLTAELLVAATASTWGAAVLVTPGVFDVPAYAAAAFRDIGPSMWGAAFFVLGIASAYATLTRGAEMRFTMMGIATLFFSQMTWQMIGGGGGTTGPWMYTLWGIALPLASCAWHFLAVLIDEHIATE